MSRWNPLSRAELRLFEMEVFGSFTPREQRHIALVLNVVAEKLDARTVARTGAEADKLERLVDGWGELYARLAEWHKGKGDPWNANVGVFATMLLLARTALGDGDLASYRAWSFLLARAVGPVVSPFAMPAFRTALIGAAIHKDHRRAIEREMEEWEESGRAAIAPAFEFTPEWLPARGPGA